MQKPGIKFVTVFVLISAILIIVLIIKTCSKNGSKEFIYEKVTTGEVKKTISVTGELSLMEAYIVRSKIGGIVESVHTDFNQSVSHGQLLIKLDSTDIDQKITRMQGTVENIKFEKIASEQDLEAKRNLYKDNLISKRAMEQAEMSHKAFLNKYNQTMMDYSLTLKERAYTKIYSPVNGIVISIYVSQAVAINTTTSLILIATSLSKMLLSINIDESDIGNIKNGQQVVFSVSAFPDKKFKGVITQVRTDPIKTGGLVTYQALVVCDNNDLLLKPGMTATATVVIDQKENVLRILNQAFLISPVEKNDASDGKKYVWKKGGMSPGKPYKKTEVKTGLVGDMYTEIVDGIKPGEEVMVKIQESK